MAGPRARLAAGGRRQPQTLRAALLNALWTPVVVVVFGAAGFLGTTALGLDGWLVETPVPVPAEVVPEGQGLGRVGVLVERHGCWSGDAPVAMEGRVPGHAVVTWPGARRAVYGGQRAARAALEHVFEGRHPRLRVHAFCR